MAAEERVTKILLVEDHSSFREALRFLLEADSEFAVVAQAGFLEEAHETIKESEEIEYLAHLSLKKYRIFGMRTRPSW